MTPHARLRIFSIFSLFLGITFCLLLLLLGDNSKIFWIPVITFSGFFIVSVTRDTLITEGTNEIGASIDSALICGLAAIAVLLNSPLTFLLSICVLFYYPENIRKRQWTFLTFNFANFLIDGAMCYFTLSILDLSSSDSYFLLAGKVLCAALVFDVSNYFMLAVSYIVEKEDWKEVLDDARRSLTEAVPLAVFCGLLGRLYISYGWPMLLIFVLPLFIGRELHASYANMAHSQSSTINTLIYALEEKDAYTAGHVERVAMFAKYIGQEFGYGPKRLERLRQAALLHDTGKLIVPNALLNKPGKLTDDEFAIIKKHEGVTEDILKAITFLKPIAHTAGGDHNAMDANIKTRKLEPYIISVCDAFDAMTSSRSYRKALSMEIAYEELEKNKGKQFHPKVVAALMKALDDRGEKYGDGYETNALHADAPIAGVGSAGIGDTISKDENERDAHKDNLASTSTVEEGESNE